MSDPKQTQPEVWEPAEAHCLSVMADICTRASMFGEALTCLGQQIKAVRDERLQVKAGLTERSKALDERERVLAGREQAVGQYRNLAADRAVEIKSLKESLDAQVVKVHTANAERTAALKARRTAEEALAACVAERKALEDKVAELEAKAKVAKPEEPGTCPTA